MGLSTRISYRGWQLWKVIVARPLSEPLKDQVRLILNEEQMKLFLRQSAAGQQHGYRVMQFLLDDGHQDQELLTAALLHDAGKIHLKSAWWDRSIVVLAQALRPDVVKRWGEGDESSWRRPFVIKVNHAEWGADYAKEAGCSPVTVELIRRHQDPVEFQAGDRSSELLKLLQWADNRN